MIRIIYNLLQVAVVILASPLLFVKVIRNPKYRGRIGGRLGIGLEGRLNGRRPGRPRIWLHALSVGETASSQPLIKALRGHYPEATLILTTTTRAGENFARQKLASQVDLFLPFPLDFWPSVYYYVKRLDPDLFILVETDFWPNLLLALRRKGVPALLVNGRISRRSFSLYRRCRWLFRPLFTSFTSLSMQTAADAGRLVELGISAKKVRQLGNLKYDVALTSESRRHFSLPEGAPLWVAGSTHKGEEEIIMHVYKRLLVHFAELHLVIAPRQVERSRELLGLAASCGLAARRYKCGRSGGERLLILDTLGDLASFYALGDFAFIGGSMVAKGGHNPLEPAAFGRPLLFGPYMDDFASIGSDLCASGGARVVGSEEELFQAAHFWLADPTLRADCGRRAQELVVRQKGATARHLELIVQILAPRKSSNQKPMVLQKAAAVTDPIPSGDLLRL